MKLNQSVMDQAFKVFRHVHGTHRFTDQDAFQTALEATLPSIPLDAASVERCAKALDERAAFWGCGDIRTQERMEVEYCARLLRALPATPIPLDAVTRDRCAQIADARAQSSKTQKVANDLYREQNGLDSSVEQDAFCDHAISVATGIASDIRALPAARGHLAQMPENAVDAVWKFIGCEPMAEAETVSMRAWLADAFHPFSRKQAVALPRPAPTVKDIAKAICCPDGCDFDRGISLRCECSSDGCEEEATAVLALFGKAAP